MSIEKYCHYGYYRTPSPMAEKSLLVSDGMGYTAESDFRIDRKSFHNYLAFYIRKGTFYVEQYGKKYIFHSGEGALMDLNKAHVYYSDPEDVAHLLWFHFRGAGTGQLMETLEQTGDLPFAFTSDKMENHFEKAFQLTSGPVNDAALSGHLYSILMEILQSYAFSEKENAALPKEMQLAVHLMKSQIQTSLTLEYISRQIGMSKYHFSHTFKKWFGISPKQYYNNLKMEAARRLLEETSESIPEISLKLGYTDTEYFRKAFKNHYGISPSRYRQS
ncbi:MAG: AraC family transcriptional regulator [Fusicatenibacter sp.]